MGFVVLSSEEKRKIDTPIMAPVKRKGEGNGIGFVIFDAIVMVMVDL